MQKVILEKDGKQTSEFIEDSLLIKAYDNASKVAIEHEKIEILLDDDIRIYLTPSQLTQARMREKNNVSD